MRAVFFDASVGRERPLEPVSPPGVRWLAEAPGGATLAAERERLLAGALSRALRYLGYDLREDQAPELYFGRRARPAALWLRPGAGPDAPAGEAAARGLTEDDLRLWALRRRYREDAPLDWGELEAAREERRGLLERRRWLEARGGGSAPSAAGVAGYKKRLRDALARDFDAPQALASLGDALRPGALSPGSQLALLRDADEALGLGLG